MSKYLKLTLHLAQLDVTRWKVSFDEVEDVLGFPLPTSARQYAAWWANQGRAQSLSWQGAGWNTVDVDMARELVTFTLIGDSQDVETGSDRQLTIADAKAGLAATFGVSLDAVEILIRG